MAQAKKKPVVKKPVRRSALQQATAEAAGLATATDDLAIPAFLATDSNGKRVTPDAPLPASDKKVALDKTAAVTALKDHQRKNTPKPLPSVLVGQNVPDADKRMFGPPTEAGEQTEYIESTPGVRKLAVIRSDDKAPVRIMSAAEPKGCVDGTIWEDTNTNPSTVKRWNGKKWVQDKEAEAETRKMEAAREAETSDNEEPGKVRAAKRVKSPKGEGLTTKIGPIAEKLLKAWTTKKKIVEALVKDLGVDEYAASNVTGVYLSVKNRDGFVTKRDAPGGGKGKEYRLASVK